MRTLLRQAKMIDPAGSVERTVDVLIDEGRIAAIDSFLDVENAQVLECYGEALAPALIDLHALCPEPGEEFASFRELGRQAARGGVGTVVVSPEANPMRDLLANLRYGQYRAAEVTDCHLHFHGALTRGLQGRELADLGRLKESGAVFASNGLKNIDSSRVMQRAMTHARGLDVTVMHRPEDHELAEGGVAHRGSLGAMLGLPGIPLEAETIILARDLQLQAATGAKYHALMLSAAQSLLLLAPASGHVSASVGLANLLMDESAVEGFNTAAKLIPPLRSATDREALVAAVREGVIRHVVSGHHPFLPEAKAENFVDAAPGMLTLPWMLPVLVTVLHKEAGMGLAQALAPATIHAAELSGLPGGRLAVGAPADLVLFNPDKPAGEWMGRSLFGRVLCTFSGGRIVYHAKA